MSQLHIRIGSLLALLLQLFVVGVVPVLDARVEAASVSGSSHVEDYGRGACLPTHDPFDCQLCRAIRAPFAAAPPLELPARVQREVPPAHQADDRRAVLRWRGTLVPRAPPAFG